MTWQIRDTTGAKCHKQLDTELSDVTVCLSFSTSQGCEMGVRVGGVQGELIHHTLCVLQTAIERQQMDYKKYQRWLSYALETNTLYTQVEIRRAC